MLGLYDAPLHRDWAFWLTVGLAALETVSVITYPGPTSGLPRWLDILLAVLLITLIFGVVPTWIRLLVRRWRWRRHHPQPAPTTGNVPPTRTAPPPRDASPPHTTPSPRASAPQEHPTLRPAAFTPAAAPVREPARPETAPPPSPDPLAVARRTLPHPVARTVHEMQRAHTHKERHEALLEAAETLAATVAVTAAGLLQAQGIGARNLADLRDTLARGGTTFGTWTFWLHGLRPLAHSHPDFMPGLPDALRNGDSGTTGHPGNGDFAALLDLLRTERNRTSHGDKPRTQEEAALRVAEYRPYFEQALLRAQFLSGLPWLLTVSCAYQRRTGTFEVSADHLMGDHPDFDRLTFPCTAPVADDTVYILGPAGPVALTPFVASRYCAECGQRELCHAHRAGHRRLPAAYKSFGRGHIVPCPELDDEIAALTQHPPRTHQPPQS